MDVQMKAAVFNPTDPISVLSFLDNYKTACDSDKIHEKVAMWLFSHFICKPAKTVSHEVIAEKTNLHQEGNLTTYSRVINSSTATYTTNNFITKA